MKIFFYKHFVNTDEFFHVTFSLSLKLPSKVSTPVRLQHQHCAAEQNIQFYLQYLDIALISYWLFLIHVDTIIFSLL